MKTVRNFLSVLMLSLVMISVTSNLQAQGRGHGKHDNPGRGHKKEKHFDRDDHWDRHDRRDYDNRNFRHGRYVTYRHHRNGPPSWAPAYGYRYNTRYVYYRDYNLYYDCYRDVFVTWTGRNWAVSVAIPVIIRNVDFRRTAVVGVDYWDDDFDLYLAKRRPSYVSIHASW